MISAYLLITTKSGREKDVLAKLRTLQNLEVANIVYGEYDIILKIRAENSQLLNKFISDNVRKIDGIQNTYTLVSN